MKDQNKSNPNISKNNIAPVEDNAAKQYELPKWEFNRNADPKEIDLQNKIIVLSRAGTDFQPKHPIIRKCSILIQK